MFVESVFCMPRRGVTTSSSGASATLTGDLRGASAGIGVCRGAAFVVRDDGCAGAVSGAEEVGATVLAAGADPLTGALLAGALPEAGAVAAAAGVVAAGVTLLAPDDCAACASCEVEYFSSTGHQA